MTTASPDLRPLSSSVLPKSQGRLPSILFHLFLVLLCAWVLSLPLFPTQDGPIHKYYVHAIASLLSGSSLYSAYAVRHPFPPYAIHYAVLLGLTRFLSFDWAEKIFIVLILLCTAYSFRYCARALGPSGTLLSLCMLPLLLHWSVFMGFLNYSLGVGLFFLAAGLWLRAGAGRPWLWIPFTAAIIALTLTHPVPLLLLIAWFLLDLVLRMVQDRRRAGELFYRYRGQIYGLAVTCLSFLYPLASADRARSASNLHSFALHRDALISSIALYGVSPFDTRSKNWIIDCYRLGLYLILLGSIALAAAGFGKRWKTRTLESRDSLLIGTLATMAAIPILPPAMNGSDFFAQRLMIFVWLGAIAAACGYANPRRVRVAAPVIAAVMVATLLLASEHFIRPVANQLRALEDQPLPPHAEGLALFDPAMLKTVRAERQLGFDPYAWSGVLPFVHGDDVMLNSPWLDLTIMPVKATPGSDLMVNRMASPEEAEGLINGNVNLAALPSAVRSPLMDASRFVVFVGTPADVQRGLAPLAGAAQAARYICTTHAWYLVCTESGK